MATLEYQGNCDRGFSAKVEANDGSRILTMTSQISRSI